MWPFKPSRSPQEPLIGRSETYDAQARFDLLEHNLRAQRDRIQALEASEVVREAQIAAQIDALRKIANRMSQRTRDEKKAEEPSDLYKARLQMLGRREEAV